MEKRDPLKEVGNISDKNEPQDVAVKEVPEVTVSTADKENGFFTAAEKAELENAEIGLDVGGGSRPKESKLRRSFLKAFDPLYIESPEKSTEPEKRPQLIIEDSEGSDTSQLIPLPSDVSDDEGAFVDAATISSDEESNKQYLLLQFYTPEKIDACALKHSENISTSHVVDSDSVLPYRTEQASTSEIDHPHIEKRKLHGPNRLEPKTNSPHSPVVVPCKKQRITETELIEAIHTNLQGDANKSLEINVDDTNSEISDIKTDSPDRSQGEQSADSSEDSHIEKHVSPEFDDTDNYPDLPESSDVSLKKPVEDNTIAPKSSDKKTVETLETQASTETYPDLTETSVGFSKGLPVDTTICYETAVKPSSDSETYPELPDTSDESSRGPSLDSISPEKTVEKTVDAPVKPSSDSETYPELPDTSDESSRGPTVDAPVKPSSDPEAYPELPDTSDESSRGPSIDSISSETYVQKTVDEPVNPSSDSETLLELSDPSDEYSRGTSIDTISSETYVQKTVDASVKPSSDSETYPERSDTSDEYSRGTSIDTISSDTYYVTKTVDAPVKPSCDFETYPELPDTSDESSRGTTAEDSVDSPVKSSFGSETYLELPDTSDESSRAPPIESAIYVDTPVNETVHAYAKPGSGSGTYPELPDTSDESSREPINSTTSETVDVSSKLNSDSETYPELPDTSDESSREPPVDTTTSSETRVKETVDASAKPSADPEIYPELPDTSDESSAELLAHKTVEELPKTTELAEELVSPKLFEEGRSEKKVDEEVVEKPQDSKESTEISEKRKQEIYSSSDKQSSLVKEPQNTCEELLEAEDKSDLESLEGKCEPIVEFHKSLKKEVSTEHVKDLVTPTQREKVVSEETTEEETCVSDEVDKTTEEVSNVEAEKELVNLPTKQEALIQTKEECKSVENLHEQKFKDNVNTEVCTSSEEKKNSESEVGSNEDSYCHFPNNRTDDIKYSKKKQETKVSDDEQDKVIVESDAQEISDEVTETISEETVHNEQTELLTTGDIKPEEGECTESQETLKEEETKSEGDSEKSIANKVTFDVESLKTKMADLSEKLSEQQQENSDLKLQLNASQQAKATLELEIRQKEEIIIKTQAEAMKNEQVYKQEIKQLREKLKENSKLIEKDGSKELEEQLKEAKARETKAIAELNQRNKDDLNYQKIMEEYENTIATRFADYQKLKEEHETATRHLANLEMAFSDVHQKYERSKTLLEGYKTNEDTLVLSLQDSEKTCKQHEERYESLKSHAQAQIEKSNKEILLLRDKYEMDLNKLKAIIKRLEIKCGSLEVSLQQKTEECAALSALCDEVTGKRM